MAHSVARRSKDARISDYAASSSATAPPPAHAALRGDGNSNQNTIGIDLSDVALAPDQGAPPIPLLSDTSRSTANPLQWDQPEDWSGSATQDMPSTTAKPTRNLSQVEDISPWATSFPKANSRQNTSERFAPSTPSAQSPGAINTALPSFPSNNNTSTAPHSPAQHVSGKRSRNPLSFFRKRPSSNSRDESAYATPPPIPTAPIPKTTSIASGIPLSPMPQVLGLDEDLEEQEREALRTEKRRLALPKLKERDLLARKAKPILPEAWDPGAQDDAVGMGGTAPGAGPESVPLALDTNFDQIDDIVDTSLRNSSLVGPKNESLSPDRSHATLSSSQASQRILNSPTQVRSLARDRTGSVTFVEHARAQTGNSDSFSSQRRPTVRRLGSSGAGINDLATYATSSPEKSGANSTAASSQRSSLRKLSKAESHFILGRPGGKLPDRDWNALEIANSQVRATPPELRQPFSESFSIATDSKALARDDRKASVASESSRLTAGSGISPTTSISNLARANRDERDSSPALTPTHDGPWAESADQGRTLLDSSYRFPSRQKIAEGPRKSSGSSGKVPSAWMAPDSWAVQPGQMRDALRDGDDEEEERNAQTQSRAYSTTSSGAALNNNGKTGSISSNVTTPQVASSEGFRDSLTSTLSARRGTVDSNMTGSSTNGYLDTSNSQSDDSALEILSGAAADGIGEASTNGAAPSGRHASRGSALGGAAAAAAGKLKLHRPSRIKLNPRPNTAGATGGGSSGRNSVSTPTKEVDGFGNWKTSKRPSTATTQSNTRQVYLRVYRDHDTHSIVTIGLTASTADLRNTMARKSIDPTAKRLFVRDKGSERPLGEWEKPAMLHRRRLEQAGYTEQDGLDEMGRDDWSYLLKFVYRPDSVTKFDSSAFGNTEPDFNRLDLQNQNLEMVPIILYKHAKWIQSLDLSGNPMSDLPLDFIQLCENMTTLRLSNLSLKRIPQSLRQAAKLTHLDLSDNRVPELSHVNLAEIAHLVSLKMQNNRLPGLPSYFADMQMLRDLNISNNRFDVFPSIVCQLPNLLQLDISFNTISELPYELGDMVNLQRLVLVGNRLVKLPTCIHKLVNLQTLDLRRNLLQDVSELFSLPKLQILQCEHNSIKHLSATFGVHLRVLEIGQNPLSKATFVAQDICALTSLNLSSANMGRLDEEVLSRLPNLTQLVLDQNTLVVLPDNLGHLSHLRKLSCSNNLLATLPDSIGQLANLEELQVHNNNLKTLPASIWSCAHLHTINVSSNLLESFPEPQLIASSTTATSYFETQTTSAGVQESRKGSAASIIPLTPSAHGSRHVSLPLSSSLTRLRLGDNRLTEDIFDVLGHLSNLQVLNLSCNEIYELPNYALSKHVKLEELYLSGNSLNSIPADVLHLLQELRILHLNGNKLQTLPAELGKVKKLVNLDVGNNHLKYNISNQQYDWNWNSSPNLRYLNLSGNQRLEIKSNPVLVSASDHRAGWKRTDSSDFQRLTNLRVLGLMDVTVTLHQMPDESEDRRVRTSLSHINQMAYGIADTLGQHEHLSVIDVVAPQFRKMENECMFGLFAGRGHGHKSASRIAAYLAEWIQFRVTYELHQRPQGHLVSPEPEAVPDVLRKAFLRLQKEYADNLIKEGSRKIGETKAITSQTDRKTDAAAIADFQQAAHWRSGASAVLAYIIDRHLFIANAGDALAVLSRNSQAVLISTKHEPFDRTETERIRSSEGWVSLHGQVNGKLDVSRSFGYYHLGPIVNAAPAVSQTDLTDSDEFVILANRTLWDFMSYQTAVDIARMERDDPMLAAQKLRDFAISYGAQDSITVMVIAVGDIFDKSRAAGRAGNGAFGAGTYPYGSLNEPTSSGYEVEGFKKITPRRAREDRDLPGDRTLARLQREVAPPIGQVAVVFTDIKNSTALWETNGGMQSAMRLHNFLLRRQLRNIGGYEVKTEGDAFMVSFQNVTSALLWCFQVQIQLLKENWPQELLESEDGKEVFDEETGELLHRGLSVRMGLHWGWPVCEADPITRRMDYFGPMVNRASRISGAADGGQILASRDVVNELRAIMGTFDDDVKLRDGNEPGATGRRLGEEDDNADQLGNSDEEEAYRLLHPNVSRDVILLRRMGFAISDIGERRLKGLETPEFLNLVYPKGLTTRNVKVLQALTLNDISPANGSKAEQSRNPQDALSDKRKLIQAPHEVFEPTIQLLNIEEIRMLGYVCLRLEALAQGKVFKGIEEVAAEASALRPFTTSASSSTLSHEARKTMLFSPTLASGGQVMALPSPDSRQMVVEAYINRHPELSMYAIRDDATDEELHTVLQQLIGRLCIVLSSLALRKHLSNFPNRSTTDWGTDILTLVDSLQQMGIL